MSSPLKKPRIQILRGVAVSYVVLFHLSPNIFPNGYLGVDIFFIVSGYVLSPRIEAIFKHSSIRLIVSSAKNFFIQRLQRLLPALSLAIVLVSLITIFLIPIGEQQARVFEMGISSLLFFSNLTAYINHGNYFSPAQAPLLHTWSLSVEQQIYFVWPLLLLILSLVYRKLTVQRFFRVYITFLVLFASGFILLTLNIKSEEVFGIFNLGDFLYYSPTTRIIEFLYGAVISKVESRQLVQGAKAFSYVPIVLIPALPFQLLGESLAICYILIFATVPNLLLDPSEISSSGFAKIFLNAIK